MLGSIIEGTKIMIQQDNTQKILSEMEQAKLRGVLKVCQKIEGDMVLLCPADKGDLRSAIGYTTAMGKNGNIPLQSGADGVVGVNKEHAPPVEFGTQPHVITIKTARVLTDGVDIFGIRVNHPGTQAQPFVRPAGDQNRGNATEIMKQELAKVGTK